MAFANSSITDIIATTIQSRSGELADNLTQNNSLLMRLQQKGNIKPFSGGNVILNVGVTPKGTTGGKRKQPERLSERTPEKVKR